MNSIEARIKTGQLAGKTVIVTTSAGEVQITGRIGHRAGASFILETANGPHELLYTDVRDIVETPSLDDETRVIEKFTLTFKHDTPLHAHASKLTFKTRAELDEHLDFLADWAEHGWFSEPVDIHVTHTVTVIRSTDLEL